MFSCSSGEKINYLNRSRCHITITERLGMRMYMKDCYVVIFTLLSLYSASTVDSLSRHQIIDVDYDTRLWIIVWLSGSKDQRAAQALIARSDVWQHCPRCLAHEYGKRQSGLVLSSADCWHWVTPCVVRWSFFHESFKHIYWQFEWIFLSHNEVIFLLILGELKHF